MTTLSPELAKRFPYLEIQSTCIGSHVSHAEPICKKDESYHDCESVKGCNIDHTEETGFVVIEIKTGLVTSCADCPTARQGKK